jgi:hypothetical protein
MSDKIVRMPPPLRQRAAFALLRSNLTMRDVAELLLAHSGRSRR